MFLCFDVKELTGGILVPYPAYCSFKDFLDGSEKYYISSDDYPDYFPIKDEANEIVIKKNLFKGFDNYPSYYFDLKLYEEKKDPFVDFKADENEWFYALERRRTINQEIQDNISLYSEIKKLRKTVNFLIERLGIEKDSLEIKEFLEYSSYIESFISKHPKNKLL